MAVVVEAPLNNRLVAKTVGGRCLLRVLVHQLFGTLSGGTHATLLLSWLRHLFLRVVALDFLSCSHSSEWRREAGANSLDHLREPEEVEQVKSDVGSQVRSTKPERQVADFHERGSLTMRVVEISVVRELSKLVHVVLGCGVTLGNRTVDIVEDQVAAVVAPDNATAEEGRSEECAVDSLVDGTRKVELVAEPVDVEERAGKLVQKEHRSVVVEERALCLISGRSQNVIFLGNTYESERENGDSRDGVSKHAPAEDVHISRAHVQIPEEVAQSLALEQTTHAIVSPDSLLPVADAAPGLALFVKQDDIQAQAVDHAALHEGDDVHIPADPGALAELGVDVGKEAGGEDGRHHIRDEGVHRKGEEDLMSVERESRQAKEVGDALEDGLQRCRRLDGIRVKHAGGILQVRGDQTAGAKMGGDGTGLGVL